MEEIIVFTRLRSRRLATHFLEEIRSFLLGHYRELIQRIDCGKFVLNCKRLEELFKVLMEWFRGFGETFSESVFIGGENIECQKKTIFWSLKLCFRHSKAVDLEG